MTIPAFTDVIIIDYFALLTANPPAIPKFYDDTHSHPPTLSEEAAKNQDHALSSEKESITHSALPPKTEGSRKERDYSASFPSGPMSTHFALIQR